MVLNSATMCCNTRILTSTCTSTTITHTHAQLLECKRHVRTTYCTHPCHPCLVPSCPCPYQGPSCRASCRASFQASCRASSLQCVYVCVYVCVRVCACVCVCVIPGHHPSSVSICVCMCVIPGIIHEVMLTWRVCTCLQSMCMTI